MISAQSRPLDIAAIRARHFPAVPAQLQGSAPPPLRAVPTEAAAWVDSVAHASSAPGGPLVITRQLRPDGGYELHVGRRRVAAVLPPDADGRHVVVNLAAGVVRSPAISRSQADSMALRIARNEAAP